jgi:hypothetical protein
MFADHCTVVDHCTYEILRGASGSVETTSAIGCNTSAIFKAGISRQAK